MRLPGRLVLVGHPVAHSLSPAMQNAALKAAGIALEYEALDVRVESLRQTFSDLAGERAAGNVTQPHKQRTLESMTRVSPTAARVGAVNTFHTSDLGELVGDNTDVAGFNAMVRLALGELPANATVTIIGAGGAAAAVLAALEEWSGARAILCARRPELARSLAARFDVVTRANTLPHAGRIEGDIVVNATTVGLTDSALPVPVESLPSGAAIFDLVYKPGETAWVRAARAAGRMASDGLPMLVEQGAASFEIWFSRPCDREVMWQAVKQAAGRA